MAKFKIRIDKIESVEKKTTEYQKISDTGNPKDDKAVYGYVPVVKSADVESKVFECEVEELDVKTVIQSIYSLR